MTMLNQPMPVCGKRGRKQIVAMAMFVAGAASLPFGAFSETLTVAGGATVIVNDDRSNRYADFEVHGTLVLTNGCRLSGFTSGVTSYVGKVSTDAASLQIISKNDNSHLPRITTGTAVPVCFSGLMDQPALRGEGFFQDGVYLYNMHIGEGAASSGSELMFAELNGDGNNPNAFRSAVAFLNLWNHNAKPAVINFKGGSLRIINTAARSFRVPDAWNKIILRGDESHDIYLYGYNSQYYLPYTGDNGTIATDGECNLHILGRTAGEYVNVYLRKAYDDGQIIWGHTGETVFSNARVTLEADNALPYSNLVARTVRVTEVDGAEQGYGWLDMNGHSAKIGNLLVQNGAYVTNTSANAAMLVFGEDDLDSEFSGTLCGDVTLVKKGTGMLTIAAGSAIPKIILDGADFSTVVVEDATDVGAWEIAPVAEGETTFTIANGKTCDVEAFRSDPAWTWNRAWTNLYLGSNVGQGNMNNCIPGVLDQTGLSNRLHRVAVESGGTAAIDVADGAREDYEYLSLSGGGLLRKTGAGEATVLGDNRVSLGGGIHVAEGTLKFQGRGCTNEWWRFTSLRVESSGSPYSTSFYIGKIGLFGVFGEWVCMGLTYRDYNSSVLENGQFTYCVASRPNEEPTMVSSSWSPNYVFTKAYSNYGLAFRTQLSSNDDHVTFTMRLPANRKPALWHSISSAGDYRASHPYIWTLETSADGQAWTEVVRVNEQKAPKPDGTSNYWYYRWRNDERWGVDWEEGLPWRIGLNNAFASVGSLGTVRVDAGATFDLSAATNAAISSIAADASCFGGTIRGGGIAANGTLDITTTGAAPATDTVLLTFDGVAGASAINGWTLRMNGDMLSSRLLRYDSSSGEVKVVGKGIRLIMR